MNSTTIESEALSLDRPSRVRLASLLIQSLDEEVRDDTEALWLAEAVRRSKDDVAQDIDGDEVLRRLRDRRG
ncbi:MAG TPA: hypothetical protein PKE66_07460 [Pyrinomonadaceae bacterium]|nr:hypothetical protein [Pyrinomonadaceae bacterium]